MSAWYLDIAAVNEPHDSGPDDNGAALCAFDVLANKRPSATFILEILSVLSDAGVGVIGTTLLGSSLSVIPDQEAGAPDVPILIVHQTPGMAPHGTHNEGTAAYRRPGAQILVRAATWAAAEAMAQAAYSALLAVRNRQVVA